MTDHTIRTRSPRLIRQDDPFLYTFEDVWDASTPEELNSASYGVWLAKHMFDDPMGRAKTITLVALPTRVLDLQGMFQGPLKNIPTPGPDVLRGDPIFCRKLRDRKVVQRAWLHIIGNLDQLSAIWIGLIYASAPIIWSTDWLKTGVVIENVGPSKDVDPRDPFDVFTALRGFLTEIPVPRTTAMQIWMETYGTNPIAEFKRISEMNLVGEPV